MSQGVPCRTRSAEAPEHPHHEVWVQGLEGKTEKRPPRTDGTVLVAAARSTNCWSYRDLGDEPTEIESVTLCPENGTALTAAPRPPSSQGQYQQGHRASATARRP